MGFEAPETLYHLVFEDPGMAGLEVTAREPTIDQMLQITGVGDVKDPDQIRTMFRLFASLLDEWNVERKGVPVPATYEGVVSQSPAFVMKIMKALGDAVAKPDPTLPAGSSTGGTGSLESSIPMTPSQPSPGT
jgi:hypothetical protein